MQSVAVRRLTDKKKLFGLVVPKGRPLSRSRQPFSGPLPAILDFAGVSKFLIEGVRLQKMRG